jgi:hypothetical protein
VTVDPLRSTNRKHIIILHPAVTDHNWQADESGEDLMTLLEYVLFLLLFVDPALMDGHSHDPAR